MKNAILIVDDSRLNRETLADILKDKYNIIEAEDGRSGLEVLEKRKDDIVLVILDIVMPGMDGFAFMEEARTRESIRNIPIVVATTETDYQTEKRCLELGVWDFIPKVFQPEIIRFRVLNTIKRSMALLCRERCTGNNVPDIKIVIQNVIDSHCCFQIVSRLILFQFLFYI
jgi:response regulator RpfG family c-di-GMP phosphodiesterase